MSIFLRKSFNKPIAVTHQGMASGTDVSFFQIPFAKLGYLKRIQVGRGCNGASGCIELDIFDTFADPLTGSEWPVPGVMQVKRKSITIPPSIAQLNWDETEDIPLLGLITAASSVSGIDMTITARLI